MKKILMETLLYLSDLLYLHFYWFYKPIYFFYKSRVDSKILSLLKEKIQRDMIVFDIGGNIGFTAEKFSALVGTKGFVHVFEPDPVNFMHLAKTLANKQNIILNNCAVGMQSGKVNLYKSKKTNVDHHTYASLERDEYIEVNMITIDEYCENKSVGRVDFIKMDTQGYDFYVLLGMKKTIESLERVTIVGELWPYGLVRAGSNGKEYLKFLEKLGFKIRSIEDENSSIEDLNRYVDEFENHEYQYLNFIAEKKN